MKHYISTAMALVVMLGIGVANAQENAQNTGRYDRIFPIWAQEAMDLGHELPKPYGLTFNYMSMDQPLIIDAIQLSGLGGLDDTISIVGDEADQTSETITLRGDVWLLPFLNAYGVIGHTKGSSKARVSVSVDMLPVPIPVPFDLEFKGTTYGAGTTLVGGIGNWFALVDVNYTKTNLDILKGEIDTLVASPRVGYRTQFFGNNAQIWVGAMYQKVEQRFSGYLNDVIDLGIPLPSDAMFHVEQHLADRWNGLFGAQVEMGNGFDLLVEGGFGTRKSLMVGLGYRF
ncbi:virulence protein [Paraferrimonas haliotis]|uniref:Outer membrane protein beta-barrel domain-containing protein n=1 Tax=Paraferrimonas haliotis TaxID=2013866 RepID=A0AA37TMW2_9GAMM|nr:virulence protein [Paraferrimonas haliotis]GLS83278.1 hypothetical protein GCM10007894_12550 [Paraferrimonas haliotis]